MTFEFALTWNMARRSALGGSNLSYTHQTLIDYTLQHVVVVQIKNEINWRVTSDASELRRDSAL